VNDDQIARTIGGNVRRVRHAREMTQIELEGASGVAQSTISRIEKGDQKVAVVVLARLARALRVNISTLLQGVK